MQVGTLTWVGLFLNGAAGSGKYDDVTIELVKQHINDDSIFEYLKTRLGNDFDISLISDADLEQLLHNWQDHVSALNEGRKLFVDRGGLNLLVAYLLVDIQRLPPPEQPQDRNN
jgi:hypothetical protein